MRAISSTSFKRAADRLEQHGDPALAFRIAELGLVRYLNCVALLNSRARALTTLRQINSRSIRFGSSSTPSGREKRSRPCRRNSRRVMFPLKRPLRPRRSCAGRHGSSTRGLPPV
jgi:hypothetical protein